MNMLQRLLSGLVPVLLCAVTSLALAQSIGSDTEADSDNPVELHHHHHHHHSDAHSDGDSTVVTFGHDARLAPGGNADSVVAILGSAIDEGEAGDVVSVFGATRVTGPVTDDAIAVFGSSYIDSKVDGDAITVAGNLELGPHAEIGGDVVVIGGNLTRDPAAIIHGDTQSVLASEVTANFDWLRNWVQHCLFYGRPLALAPGLGWAWILASSFLALYLLLAVLFPVGINRCVQTFESQPGHSIIASVLGVLLVPIVIVLLCITVIGIAAVPFLVVGLFCASLLGKAVMLAWLGRRCLQWRAGGLSSQPVLAVAIGGVIVLVLYLIPVVGFLVYKLLGLLGFGIVLLSLLHAVRARRVAETVTGASAAAAAPGVATTIGESVAAEPVPVAPVTAASASALPRAGFWLRMIALLIDLVLVGILLSILKHVANLELVVLATYGAIMWKLRGATIGGIVFDLQVVRQDGREMDWSTSIVRALACFLSLAAAGLGFLWIAFDSNKQAWHDKIAGTVVIRTARRISLV